MTKATPSIERLRFLLSYDPESGVFRWRAKPNKRTNVGAIAGFTDCWGHRRIEVEGVRIKAHRLAWLFVCGEWPRFVLDHINGNPDDNRIANLRPATASQNMQNSRRYSTNTSGYKGVSLCRQTRRWRAKIVVNGRNVHLGRFLSAEQARSAYASAAAEYFGEFARLS
ncbi:MAG: HNH endonuclease [Rhizobiales bacterium]|nr:HNH endonuclease [Hyphomicrobiales bacterium]MBI3674089.1 HNH endonuclease [Hyphomicrobiales bacterium]